MPESGKSRAYARSLGMRFMIQPVVLADDGVWNGVFDPDYNGRLV